MMARKRDRLTVTDKILSMLLILFGAVGTLNVISPSMFRSATDTPTATVAKAEPVKPVASPVLSRSVPTHLTAPDISLSTDLITTGQNAAGELAVPERYDIAAWYDGSPTPGERGPSVIVGHVDTYRGPAVFFYLKELQPGQKLYIDREDGSRVTFKVDRMILVDQDAFPTQEVYGNIDYAGLRLITCGGAFNPATGHYLQNTVIFATYVPDGT